MSRLFWLNDERWSKIEPLLPHHGSPPRVDGVLDEAIEGTRHCRELVGIRIEFARPLRNMKPRLDAIRAQVLADRVPRQAGAP